MKKSFSNTNFIISLILAHVLLFITYTSSTNFWIFFGITQIILIIYSVSCEKIYYINDLSKDIFLGIITSILLFLVFIVGNLFIELLSLPFEKEITALYSKFTPDYTWQYFILLLIIIPGEEFFWRGLIQKKLLTMANPTKAILLASILYALGQMYCGFFILPIIAILAGVFWGYLYYKYKSLFLVTISHIVFDLFLFIIFPFQ